MLKNERKYRIGRKEGLRIALLTTAAVDRRRGRKEEEREREHQANNMNKREKEEVRVDNSWLFEFRKLPVHFKSDTQKRLIEQPCYKQMIGKKTTTCS